MVSLKGGEVREHHPFLCREPPAILEVGYSEIPASLCLRFCYCVAEGVMPVSKATVADVDVGKYDEFLENTFEQILEPLGIKGDEVGGQQTLG